MVTVSEFKKEQRKDILLSLLCSYHQNRKEISLSAIQDSIRQFQQKSELGYSFSEHFHYSFDLMEDLKDLIYLGFVHEYNYRHDSFLPKRYFRLTPLGSSRGKKLIQELLPDQRKELYDAVATAINDHEQRWRLWTRYEQED